MGEEKGMVGGGWRDEGEDCNKVNISLLSPTHVHTHTCAHPHPHTFCSYSCFIELSLISTLNKTVLYQPRRRGYHSRREISSKC